MSGPLDVLGAAIVERLLHHGADVLVADDGRVQVMFPASGFGRRPVEHDQWMRGFTDGAMRELWELVQLVPGAREAVRDHVRLYPCERHANGVLA